MKQRPYTGIGTILRQSTLLEPSNQKFSLRVRTGGDDKKKEDKNRVRDISPIRGEVQI
jgi:hypothetical protein